jgi:hypothetical protein
VSRIAKWLLIGLGAVVVVAIAGLVAVPWLVDTPRVQALIGQTITQSLGRPAKFSSVAVRVLPRPAVVVKDLEVADDPAFGPAPFLKLGEAEVRLRVLPLLTLHVQFGDFVLAKPTISLVQAKDGRWNYATLGGGEPRGGGRGRGGGGTPGGVGAALASRVKISDGVVTYESRAGGAPARYRIEGLDLTLTSTGGPVGVDGRFVVKPGDVKVSIADGAVTLGGRTIGEAPVRARVTVDGKNVRDVVAFALGPEPAIGGGIKGTLAVTGTVADPRAAGDIKLTDVAVTETNPQCPEPKRRTLTLGAVDASTVWEHGQFASRPLKSGLAGGTIVTNLVATFDRGLRVQLDDLTIRGLPLDKVLVDFLCQGYAVTGPLDLTGQAAARLGDLWHTLDGRGQVKIGAGKVVGAQALALLGGVVRLGGAMSSLLSADVPSSLFSSPLEYESITATYRIKAGVVSTNDLLYTSKVMKIAGAGTYGLASGAIDMDLVVSHGRGEVKAKVTGSAASPSIRVSPSTLLRDVDAGKVEKGLKDLLKQFR